MNDTFTQLPLELDPATKAISLAPSASPSEADSRIEAELKTLNQLHRSLVGLDSPNVPPPPLPINPKRSAQINKLRESANTFYRKSNAAEAVRLYGYAIDMALGRPGWEPCSLVREELAALYANRAQAHMAQQAWADAWIDAQCSVECKAGPASPPPVPAAGGGGGTAKAWWRGGKALVEMGRWEEAKEWLDRAFEAEGKTGDGPKELLALLAEVEDRLRRHEK
jgi:translocation protein SEC72